MKILWTIVICLMMSVLRVSVNFNGNSYDELGQFLFVTAGLIILVTIWWDEIKVKFNNL